MDAARVKNRNAAPAALRGASHKGGILVLVRHGESRFNRLNLFTGWVDASLTEKGLAEARKVAGHCRRFRYDAAFVSNLERTRETLQIILTEQKKIGVFSHNNRKFDIADPSTGGIGSKSFPIYSSDALNERNYGDLQGMDKREAEKIYGSKRVHAWQRGYAEKPPGGESLKQAYKRSVGYFRNIILPRLEKGQTILIVGHGNTLRALIKFLERIRPQDIPSVSLPFGRPLVYSYCNGKFARIEGSYVLKRRHR